MLVGSKAAQVGRIIGDEITTLDGHHAVKHIDANSPGGLAARIYTLMVYDSRGAAVFGFNTSIGVGTDPVDQQTIISTLDGIARSLTLETAP
jgi:hypothetical protein